MNQLTFGDAEYLGKRKRTRREVFLAEMEQVIPWDALLALIEPVYPKAGRGRRPYPLATMLRIHLMQNWFGLSDPGMEEALYEIVPLRQFARLSATQALPDETTILNFRRLLETHDLSAQLLEAVNAHLRTRGLLLQKGTIVDATIIHAPSSTKNREGQRGVCQHSCPLVHAATCFAFGVSDTGFSGLSQAVPAGVQFRMGRPRQRSGRAFLACS